MGRRVLCLDCDGVIFNTVHMMKNIISGINYCCSDDFKIKIIDRAYKNNEMDLWRIYTDIQKITRDEVLEETNDLYKGRIDYNNMYVFDNTFHGVIEIINMIWASKLFDKIYITTHVNSAQEIEAKKKFFDEYLPMVELFTIRFNDKPYISDKKKYYDNANRKRTNKPQEFFNAKHEKPENTTFIDDSSSICDQARALGAKAFYRDSESDNPLLVFHEVINDLKENSKKRTISKY